MYKTHAAPPDVLVYTVYAGAHGYTVRSLKMPKVVSIHVPEYAQDHESDLRSDRGPVVHSDF